VIESGGRTTRTCAYANTLFSKHLFVRKHQCDINILVDLVKNGLSVHALLEGLALGLRSSASDFAVISAIICAHKLFAALALGAVLADASKRMRR
jgi:hypothetical protein